jgi:hypothetical protein
MIAVGKIICSATTTLPPRGSWLRPETEEILAFGAKALFDYASEKATIAISERLKPRLSQGSLK